jgi:hypothetical protein
MAIYTDGSTYLSTTFSTAIPALNDATVMCWIYLPTVAVGYRVFVCINGTGAALETYTDGLTSNFSTSTSDYLGQAFDTNTWYHMAMTIVSSAGQSQRQNHIIRGYVNGKLQVQANDTSTFGNWTGCLVGCYQGITSYARAIVKDVRLWTKVLNNGEINREMQSCQASSAGLVLWSKFDDGYYVDNAGQNVWTVTGAPILCTGPNIPYPKSRSRLTI